MALCLVAILLGCSDMAVVRAGFTGFDVYVTVQGTVVEGDTGQPIEGLRVALARDDGGRPGERLAEVRTDALGGYTAAVRVPDCVSLGLIVFETPDWAGASTWFARERFGGAPGCREGPQTIDVEMVPRSPS